MAGLIRTLFKSKKSKKEEEIADDIVFRSCSEVQKLQRQPTARFADDCQLSATAAYHTTSAPKLRKGPQSCPGGYKDDLLMQDNSKRRVEGRKRQDYVIDRGEKEQRNRHYRSRRDLQSDSDSCDDENDRAQMFERKSQFYLQKWESSERQRREDRRMHEQLEKERNSIQHAMSNMAYCMASVQQMEQLKKERDQYRKEMSKYKSKCERLESKCEQLETAATMSPNYPGMQHSAFPPLHHHPSPYHTPQYPPPFQFPQPSKLAHQPPQHPTFMNSMPLSLHRSTNFLAAPNPSGFSMSNTPTTIGSEGAGESLSHPSDVSFLRPAQPGSTTNFRADRFYDDDEDEVKNFREVDQYVSPSPYSELSASTAATSHHV